MSDERCETCRFMLATTERAGVVYVGVCRRYPPQVYVDGELVSQCYPETAASCWCGEYDKRLEPLTDDEWALVDLMDPVAGADLLLRRRVRGVVDVRPKEKA